MMIPVYLDPFLLLKGKYPMLSDEIINLILKEKNDSYNWGRTSLKKKMRSEAAKKAWKNRKKRKVKK